MDGKLRVFIALLIWGLVLGAGLLGLLRSVDDSLRDLRFSLERQAPSGSIVFVDIDTRSLDEVGVWPWPRSLHAQLVDRLLDAGAENIAFDVDFSAASTEAEDRAFEEALERAGGYVQLAALRQLSDGTGEERVSLPLERFRVHADPVTVNVPIGSGGLVRTYPFGMELDGRSYPSLGASLTGVRGPHDRSFIIAIRSIRAASTASRWPTSSPASSTPSALPAVRWSSAPLRSNCAIPSSPRSMAWCREQSSRSWRPKR